MALSRLAARTRPLARPATQLGASLRAEALKLRKWPAIWVGVLAVVGLAVLHYYILPYGTLLQVRTGVAVINLPIGTFQRQMLPDQLVPVLIQSATIGSGGDVIALVLGALVAGNEFGWGTLTTVLAQRPSRLAVYAGKVLALAALLAVLVLAVLAADAAASLVVAAREGRPVAWPPAAELARAAGAAWLILGMWAACGLMLAVLFRGAALAIGLGLLWRLAIEVIVQNFAPISEALTAVHQRLPGANALALDATFGVPGQPGASVVGPVEGSPREFALVLVAYLVAFLALGAVLWHSRDVV